MKAYSYIILILLTLQNVFADNPYNFKATNGPYAGYIYGFCYDSTTKDFFANADHIYKLNRTTEKWEKQFDSLDKYSNYFFRLIYADSIYIVSFREGSGDVIYGEGLFRSTNKGKNWTEIKKFDKYPISIVNLNGVLYAACGSFSRGVYRSSDFGLNWILCEKGFDTANKFWHGIYQIEKKETNDKDYLFVLDYDNGIYRSTDSGDNWLKINNNIPDTFNLRKVDYSFFAITNENKIFIATSAGIFVSNNFGENWDLIIAGLDSLNEFNFDCIKSDKNGNIFAGKYGYGIYTLNKKDSVWKSINNGIIPLYIRDIYFDENPEVYFAATDAGIYKTTNEGNSWFFYDDGIKNTIETNSVIVAKNGNLIAGTESNGIYLSTDNGNNWITANNGNSENNITKLIIDSKGNIYASSSLGSIYKSKNNG